MSKNHDVSIRGIRWLLTAVCLCQFAVCAVAESPNLIPFQGHLTRPKAGAPTQYEPVPDGKYDILFTLYTTPAGGEGRVWGPERHAGVVVVNGLVNVLLGSVSGFKTAVDADPNFFGRVLYVGITIDADNNPNTADLELVPRQVLLPAVYANNTNLWDGIDSKNVFVQPDPTSTTLVVKVAQKTLDIVANSEKLAGQLPAWYMPTGSIIAYSGSTEPTGWLICDGRPVSSQEYYQLYTSIGKAWGDGTRNADGTLAPSRNPPTNFNLPDFRGRFLRGLDGTANRDPDKLLRMPSNIGGFDKNQIGSMQNDEFKSHTHNLTPGTHQHMWHGFNIVANGNDKRVRSQTNYPADPLDPATENDGAHDHGPKGGNETRPQNCYVNYIIKY